MAQKDAAASTSPESDQYVSSTIQDAAAGTEETITSYKWSHREMVRLIDLWVNELCLWKTLLPEYKDKIHQLGALKRIQKSMEEAESPAPSVNDIAAKITGLKLYYMTTKLEREDMVKHGAREEDLPVILMPYYKMLQFLNEADDPLPPAQMHTSVQANAEGIESTNPDDVFCSYMAILLKEIEDGRIKEKLKVDVQAVIFRARFPEEELLIAPAANAMEPNANVMNPSGNMANHSMSMPNQSMNVGNQPLSLGNQAINVGNQQSMMDQSVNGANPSMNMVDPSVRMANPSLSMRHPTNNMSHQSMNNNQPPMTVNQPAMNPNQPTMKPNQPAMINSSINTRPSSKYATRYATHFPGASRFDQSTQQLNSV